jgi:mono/diheme cytochrome c family protein
MTRVVKHITTIREERMRRAWITGTLVAAAIVAVLGAGDVGAQGEWQAPAPDKAKKNPVPGGAKVVETGKKVAQVNCVLCHGDTGKGNGPGAAALNPKPADWTSKRVQDESDGELFWKISNGRGPMPSWKHLPDTDRWSVVHYIRSLKGK